MPSYRRLIANEPLWIFAVLWPVVFLAPLLPGLPKAWLNSLSWRQELVASLLLLITFGLLLRRISSKPNHSWKISISEYGIFLPLTFFILWGCISLSWAQGWLNTIHYCFTWTIYLNCFILMRQIARKPRLLRLSIVSLAVALLIISIASAIGGIL